MGKDEDTILVKELKKGNKEAFRKLYDRYHEPLYFLAKRYLKDDSLVEDAVQDIFLKLWDKRSDLIESSSIKSFLFTMLKNHVLNVIRDRKTKIRILKSYNKLNNNNPRNSADVDYIYKEYQQIVNKGLDKLSPARRKIFEMKTEQGLTNSRIAEIRDVSVNTVKTQYYLATQFIRNYLSDHADIK